MSYTVIDGMTFVYTVREVEYKVIPCRECLSTPLCIVSSSPYDFDGYRSLAVRRNCALLSKFGRDCGGVIVPVKAGFWP